MGRSRFGGEHSGLDAPLTSPRVWRRAKRRVGKARVARRSLVVLFRLVFMEIVTTYVDRAIDFCKATPNLLLFRV